jgi:hypothetical protein
MRLRDGPLGWGKGDLKKVSLHLLWVPRGRATYAEAMGRLKDESRRRERDYSEVCTGLPFGNVRTPDAILDGLLRLAVHATHRAGSLLVD